MGNVKIIFANENPNSGKSTLCLAFANYISSINKCSVDIFDCDYNSPLFFKREDELNIQKILKSEDTLTNVNQLNIIPFCLSNGYSLFNLLSDINVRDGYFFFDIPSVISPIKYLQLLLIADFVICPVTLTIESILNTASFLLFIERFKVKTEKEYKKTDLKVIIVPNMISEKFITNNIKDIWDSKLEIFNRHSKVAPGIPWVDNFFKEMSSRYNNLSDSCSGSFSYMLNLINSN